MVKSMRALALLGLLLSSTSWAQTSIELATKAGAVLGVGRDGQCSSCHSLNSESTIKRWASATARVESCLGANNTSKEKLACIAQQDIGTTLELDPSQLGIYAAGLHLDPIKSLVNESFTAAQARTILAQLASEAMPLNTNVKLTATQFSDVQKWFKAGTPELASLLAGEQTTSNTCEASYEPALNTHLKNAQTDSWKTRLEANQLAMFGCTATGCFNQTRNGVAIFPDVSTSTATKAWKLDASTQMRVLTTISNNRQYWIRSSADGRFVGFGGKPSGIIDLQSLLSATATTQRIISVDALYDPGFLPDDSGFVFQSNTTGMCNMSILRSSATKSITFGEDACTVLSSKIPLYQTIGASLNGDDYMALASSYQRDSGTDSTLDEFIPTEDLTSGSQNKLNLYNLAFDGQTWVRKAGQTFATPFEIDWVLSHSNQLGMSRLQAERDGVVRTSGFNLYKFGKNTAGSFTKTKIATLCGEGLKGDFSYDERFYVTYSYIRADQYKLFGYASASDPAFQAKLKTGSADLILHDLATQESYAITNMKADQYALFPHFRADNWIYFEVVDRSTGKRTVLASDAAVLAERKAPLN